MERTEVHVTALEDQAHKLVRELRRARLRREILRPLMSDGPVQRNMVHRVRGTQAVLAYNELTWLLLMDSVRDVFRLFVDKDSRSCSLRNLLRAAWEVRDVLERKWIVGAEGVTPPATSGTATALGLSEMGIVGEIVPSDPASEFERIWTAGVCAEWQAEQRRLRAISRVRHKLVAHFEPSANLQDVGLNKGDVLDCGDRCERIAVTLVTVVLGFEPDLTVVDSAESACAMWDVFASCSAPARTPGSLTD